MFERSEFMNFGFENKINKIIFHQQGSFLFVDAGDERPLGSSMTSRADELKILFIKFLICSLIRLYKENEPKENCPAGEK